jgi:methionyl-tRNA formyltransferase
MDSGDILAREIIPLGGRETSESLGKLAAEKAAAMLPDLLDSIASGRVSGRPQNHGEATYCSLISREDGIVDWTRCAGHIDAQIRAYTPWPLCRTSFLGQCLFILEASPLDEGAGLAASNPAPVHPPPGTVLGVDKRHGILIQTGGGLLAVRHLQLETRKALDWRAFLNGVRNFTGSRLGGKEGQETS